MAQGIDPSECLQAITGFLNTDGRTSLGQSHQFQQYLLSLRDHSMYASTLLAILGSDRIVENPLDEDGIRLFCLTALHDWTKKWWPQMNSPQHFELRNSISTSIVSTISDLASTGYCSKCASLIVEIAERQFPEQWPSFVDDLLALWMNGSFNKQQTTLKTLHDLYTDCTDPDFTGQLSTIRRQEIISAMQPYHKQIIGLINEFLSTHLQQYLFNRGNVEYLNGPVHIRSMILAIELMTEMATVITIEDWLTCENNKAEFITLFYFTLQIPEIQVLMATLLEKLCRHEMTKESSEQLVRSMLSFFTRKENTVNNNSNDTIFLTPLSEDEEEQIKYIATVTAVMSGFLQSNWTLLESMMVKESQANSQVIKGEVQQILQNILRLVSNPMSLKVAGESIMDMQKIFHGAKLYQCPILSDCAGAILTAFFDRAKRAIFIDDANLEAEPSWFTVEFEDDKEEYNEFFGTYISKCQLLLIEMIREVPMTVIAYIQEQFQFLQQLGQQAYAFCQTNHASLPTSKQQQQQFKWFLKSLEKMGHVLCRVVTVSLDQLVQLFASEPTIETKTVPAGGSSNKNKKRTPEEEQILQHERTQRYAYQQSIQNSVQFLAQLLSWLIPEDRGDFVPRLATVLQKEQLRLLGGTSAIFTLSSFTRAILPEILNRLFQYVFLADTHPMNLNESASYNTNATGSVSDLAATTIASFLHRCAKHIEDMSLFDMILQTSSQLLTSEDTANNPSRETTKMAMRETLIVLSNFLPLNNPMKSQLISLATEDIVKQLLVTQSQLLSSVDQFIRVNQELMVSGNITNERELISKWTSLLSPLRDGLVSFVQVTRKIDMSAMDAQVYRLLFDAFHQAKEETTVFFTTVNHQNANSTINKTPVQVQAYLIKQLHRQYASLLSGNSTSSNMNAINSVIATLSDPNQVIYLFPLAQAWFQVLTCVRQLLSVLVQLSLATTDHAAVSASNITQALPLCIQQACHQAALSDICRLLNKKYQISHLQGWELHELWRNLWINVWKTLDMACRQRIFYLWSDQATFVKSEMLWIALTNIPSHHLGRLLRYFVSGYLLNVVANPSAESSANYSTFLFHFMEIMDSRLKNCWSTLHDNNNNNNNNNNSNKVLSAIDDDGLSSIAFGGSSDDNLLPSTSDELYTLRDNRIRELMGQYADVLCELLGLKGPLCMDTSISSVGTSSATAAAATTNNNAKKSSKQQSNNSTNSNHNNSKENTATITNEDKKTCRREYVRYLLFQTPLVVAEMPANTYATLGQRLCVSLSWLLTIPDVQVFKTSLTMVNHLMEEIQRSYADVTLYESVWKHYELFFMKDVFMLVLKVLLLQENWSMGLGWDMVDYLLLILRMYVLVLPLDVPTTATTASGITHSSQFNVPRQRSNVPLEQLLATALVTPAEVDHLIHELSRGNAKKRQRAIVKDFISLVMIAKIHDASTLQLQGSELVGHVPKVNTNATDETARKKAKSKKAQSIAASIFASLVAAEAQDELTAGLFDDI